MIFFVAEHYFLIPTWYFITIPKNIPSIDYVIIMIQLVQLRKRSQKEENS